MHRSLPLLALASVIAGCSPERTPEITHPLSVTRPDELAANNGADDQGIARLTVYSGDYEALADVQVANAGMPGYALVARPLHYTLKAGDNAVSASGVPPAMDVEAAMLRPVSAGVTVESQRYIAALSGSLDVMSQMVGHKVTVEHTAGGAKLTDNGVLLAANEGLTLALPDGRIKVIRDYDNFSVVDGTELIPQQAALHWMVRASKAGDAEFVLSYPMGGMAWRAEYLATLATGDSCRLVLDGAALVANRSAVTFPQARLTLVAGEPNRERRAPPSVSARPQMMMDTAAAAPSPAMPTARTAGEYHAYELPRPLRIASGTTERVALFQQGPAIACERRYVVDAAAPEWQPPQPLLDPGFRGDTGPLPVVATINVPNTRAARLGRALPAGRVRVFDGNDLLGESRLEHTAVGSDIQLEVGKAFDLTARRENTAFRVDRAGRTITESFAVTLTNAKPAEVSIRVIEPLPRWSDWSITESSVPSKKKDARHAEFDVAVPAGGQAVLTYTVRYRWAPGITP